MYYKKLGWVKIIFKNKITEEFLVFVTFFYYKTNFFIMLAKLWQRFTIKKWKGIITNSDWLLVNQASQLLSSNVFIGLSRVYELFWLVALAFQCVMSAKRLLNWRNEVCAAMELSLLMGAKLVRDLMFDVLSWIIHMNLMNGIR